MTMHIDLTTPRNLDAYTEALLSSIKRQQVVSLQRVADLTGTISRLSQNQCIWRKCGLSCTGWFDKEANGYECENECEYDTGGRVIVFTQADLDEYLPNASEADFDWLNKRYPALMKAMEQRYNAEMAGVI